MLTNKLHHTNIRAGGLVAAFAFALTSFVPQYSYGQGALEEIIVTARKREENLQEIPLTVNAFTEAALEARGITSLQDIADSTPGFDFAQAFGRNDFRPVMRGQSNIEGRANAGLFLEGIIIEQGNATIPLSALERVEVVKGPQSTLYGRSTLAGAVNYVLKKPGDEFTGEVTAEYGERDHVQVDLHASGPIGEAAGLAITLSHYERGGEYDNYYPGNVLGTPEYENEVGGEETDSLTAVLTFDPTDRISLQGHFMYEETDDDHYAFAVQPASANNCYRVPPGTQPMPPAGTPVASVPRIGSPHYGGSGYYCGRIDVDDVLAYNEGNTKLETSYFNDPGTEYKTTRLGLRADMDVTDAVTLTSVTGYNNVETQSRWDLSWGTEDLIFFGPRGFVRVGFLDSDDGDFDDFSQELRLSFDGGNAFRSVFGFYYYESDFKNLDGGTSAFSGAIKETSAPSTLTEQEYIQSWSVFGSVEFDFMEKMTVGAEFRYNEDDIEKGGGGDTIKRSFDAFLPKFTASYKANDDFMLYANISKGNKPGDVNIQENLPDSERPVDEEDAWNFEFGIKSAWMDNRVIANAAVYHIDWSDQQLTTTRFINNEQFSILENIGKSTVTGIELDLAVQLTDFWDARIGYAWTDTEIDELLYAVDEGAQSVPGTFKEAALIFGYTPDGNVLISGTELPQTSKHQLSLSSTLHGNVADSWSWFLRGDFNYNSRRYDQVYNLAHTGSRERVNLRGGIKSGNFDVEVWVDNLFDNETPPALIRYAEFGAFFSTTRVIGVTLPEKRRIGVTARYRF